MKIRTIVGVLLVLALVLGSTGVAAAKTSCDWVEAINSEGDTVLVPPSWVIENEDEPTADNPNDRVPPNWVWIYP